LGGAWLVGGISRDISPSPPGARVGLNSASEPGEREPGDASDGDEGQLKAGIAKGELASDQKDYCGNRG
jgi:hypothetical protein